MIRFLLLFSWIVIGYSAEIIDRIVAVVNDDVILLSELKNELFHLEKKAQKAGLDLSHQAMIEQSLQSLILIKLQLEQAKKLGLDVEDEQVIMAMQRIAEQNGLSLDEMADALQKEEGLSLAEYQQQLKQEILIQKLRQKEVTSRIEISESEIEHYLSQNEQNGLGRFRLGHILIAVPEDATEREKQTSYDLAQQIITQIKQGQDFSELAMQYSDGPEALKGGDMGWLDWEQIPSLFIKPLRTMKKGDISPILEAGNGFHIIQLIDQEGNERHLVKQTRARHILIRIDEDRSDQEAQAKLKKIYHRIQKGEDFAELARLYSDDKASGLKGGDLGWINPGSLVPEFENQMNQLAIGAISPPFKTPFGWHIVQVLERRTQDITEQSRREEAIRALREQRSQDAWRLYLSKLHDQALIEIKTEALESL